ncbi:polysaccharide deacetylase family protein [Aromatoleum sp.]|uniref:polysaccharide deacetylase family protein n=1 Tax=Aromatoleum sp. TaxID=2307007 RepID=UPI002FC9A0F9
MMLTRLLAGLLSPRGGRGRLSILIFHRVHAQPDPLFPDEPDAERFDKLLSWIGSSFTVMPLDRAIAALRAETLPPRALAITFDDGYADNYQVALPLLQKHGMSATFFVAAGFINGGRMWNDVVIEVVRGTRSDQLDLRMLGFRRYDVRTAAERRAAIDHLLPQIKYLPSAERASTVADIAAHCAPVLPDDLMMTSAQLRALRAAGMTIGGHTRTHPILSRLDDGDAYDEISGGKTDLERIVGEPVTLFAYPNGKPGRDYSATHAVMVERAGFAGAVSTSAGVARTGTDVFQLPRFTPWDRTEFRFGLRLVNNLRCDGRIAA